MCERLKYIVYQTNKLVLFILCVCVCGKVIISVVCEKGFVHFPGTLFEEQTHIPYKNQTVSVFLFFASQFIDFYDLI